MRSGRTAKMMASSQSPPPCLRQGWMSKPLIRPPHCPHQKRLVKIEPNLQAELTNFLYVESKRARLDRERRSVRETLLSAWTLPEDIAWPVPGLEFIDPRHQSLCTGGAPSIANSTKKRKKNLYLRTSRTTNTGKRGTRTRRRQEVQRRGD